MASSSPQQSSDKLESTAFISHIESISKDSFQDDVARKKALDAARALCMRLESPMDTMHRWVWTEPSLLAAAKFGTDVHLFETLSDAAAKSLTSDEIAKSTGTDPQLMRRMLRNLASNNVVRELGPDTYAATDLVQALTRPEIKSCVAYYFEILTPAFLKLPYYLAENRNKAPTDAKDGAWQYAFNTELSHFDWLKEHPKESATFNNVMKAYGSEFPPWFQFYPAEERLIQGASDDGPLLVDVGGSIGHDVGKFAQKFPQKPGRLFLQDLPEVIEQAKVDTTIEAAGHNFFEPQPLKGARAYYMHSVLHDWPDTDALKILENLKPAMKKGYSKILLNEVVIPATNAQTLSTAFDFTMMSLVASAERDEATWKSLVESAGMKISGIWKVPNCQESVIEVELA